MLNVITQLYWINLYYIDWLLKIVYINSYSIWSSFVYMLYFLLEQEYSHRTSNYSIDIESMSFTMFLNFKLYNRRISLSKVIVTTCLFLIKPFSRRVIRWDW